MRRLRLHAGSVSALVEQTVLEVTRRTHAGLTFPEIHALVGSDRHGRPISSSACMAALRTLVARGEVERIGLRDTMTVFGHRDYPGLGECDWRPAEIVSALVCGASSDHPVAVLTRDVRAAFVAAGRPITECTGQAVSASILQCLKRHRVGWRQSFLPPSIHAHRRIVGERTINYLLPAASAEGPTVSLEHAKKAPGTRCAAMREVITAATAVAGRPVTRAELRKAVQARVADESVCRHVEESRVSRMLEELRTGPLAIATLVGPLTQYHSAPRRFSAEPASLMARVACTLEDISAVYRPHMEQQGVAVLRAMMLELGAGSVSAFADLRAGCLSHRVLTTVLAVDGVREAISSGGVDPMRELHELLQGALDIVRTAAPAVLGWWEVDGLRKGPPIPMRNAMGARLADLRTVEQCVSPLVTGGCEMPSVGSSPAGRLAVVGEAAAVSNTTARRYADLVATRLQTKNPQHLLREARRMGVGAGDRWQAWPTLDRVDALVEAFRLAGLSRTAWPLVRSAAGLLGHVVRDPAPIRALLAGPDRKHTFVRTSAVVALGLLGEMPTLEEGAISTTDVPAIKALCLAAVLADLDRADAWIAALDREVTGPAQAVTDRALERLETGRPLSVVE